MSKGIYAALSGAIASQTALDVTAENLANASSAGFQRLQPMFREVLERANGSKVSATNSRFTALAGTALDTTAGAQRATGRPLDIALPEKTFLAVSTDRGERYTRNGALTLTTDGFVLASGSRVVGEDGQPIHVDGSGGAATTESDLSITADGQLMSNGAAVGRLKFVTFPTPGSLGADGGGKYAATAQSGDANVTSAEVAVGALEDSNANPVESMTELVKASRTFDAYERAIDTFRDADRRVVGLPGT